MLCLRKNNTNHQMTNDIILIPVGRMEKGEIFLWTHYELSCQWEWCWWFPIAEHSARVEVINPQLSTLLYECEVWCLQEDLFNRLRSLHKRCIHRSIACALSAFIMPFITTLVQRLLLKGSTSWTSKATITIRFFVGLATLLECLWLGRCGSYLLAG